MSVNLKHVLDRFLALIDLDDLSAFILLKLTTDPEAQGVLAYLKGPDATAIVDHLWNDTEYVKVRAHSSLCLFMTLTFDPVPPQLVRWLYENGLTTIYNDINALHAFLGWEPVSGPSVQPRSAPKGSPKGSPKSLASLLQELLDRLPLDLLTSLALELVTSGDPAVLALILRLRDPALATSWHAFRALEETGRLVEDLERGGVEVGLLFTILEGFFGWASLNIFSTTLLDLHLL